MPLETVMLLSVWAAGAVLSELRRGGRLGAPVVVLMVLRRVPEDGLVCSDDGSRRLPSMTVSR
jgi:hypothetical protein